MNRCARTVLVAAMLSLALPLAGCESFDPADMFGDLFSAKKKLPGDRRAVFPEGVPGVAQGVPPELVKGAEPQPEPAPVVAQEPPKPKAKPKPAPKTAAVAKRPPQAATSVTVRPSNAPQDGTVWPEAPPQRQQQRPAATQWPDQPQQSQSPGGVQWPDPPSPPR